MKRVLVVGSGLFGCVIARELTDKGIYTKVIEKREHLGGNIYCQRVEGIDVHKYGAHIFHTNDREVWDYVNRFVEFNRYTNSPLALSGGELYNLPFNMNTFNKLWGVKTPQEAREKIENQRGEYGNRDPKNLEEQALCLVGSDIYKKFIKGYTEKQWGTDARNLPAFIIRRIPVRYTYDNNYFNDRFQGIPERGYNELIENLLEGINCETGVDFFELDQEEVDKFDYVVYTGPIDRYFNYSLGKLEYRSLRFEIEVLEKEDFQGNAVVNYCDREVPFTRIIEHKHFLNTKSKSTVITKEYPADFSGENEPFYPINDDKNTALYKQYRELSKSKKNVLFGGRLAEYKYYDMDKVISSALYNVTKVVDFLKGQS
ncbi:UDP-galactopyranose mutase [Vibrio cholerae]|uniref:UDP-galactopyranose mutase n=1 Tax=Vibrio cholerae TaxID=666 RepID=UPI000619034F|nr:UDP-galactopyranose mutase [Vibrio cholerae]CFW14604.1 UDP-galactopyranose mutase [Vibrio cholerae]CPR25463.1 UDP-galactopyranose mutase [Vibrio cholerae]CPR25464.1 UDP-galactopyranose mutase [Vibrio cholerae]